MSARAGRAASASNRAMLWRMGLRRPAASACRNVGVCAVQFCCAVAHVRLLQLDARACGKVKLMSGQGELVCQLTLARRAGSPLLLRAERQGVTAIKGGGQPNSSHRTASRKISTPLAVAVELHQCRAIAAAAKNNASHAVPHAASGRRAARAAAPRRHDEARRRRRRGPEQGRGRGPARRR